MTFYFYFKMKLFYLFFANGLLLNHSLVKNSVPKSITRLAIIKNDTSKLTMGMNDTTRVIKITKTVNDSLITRQGKTGDIVLNL
jgi:hypothetical protein